ncbi:uncharacterized protein E5676_scaffold225G00020 [Cucumis melo var. makuwa]|uniref:Uncharacterized protein n=1 Tax=Cucumis melo var. makuwa TaxID=1194695 RepID=A0A5D3DVB6_CUCMM|nr:uncharacterized protein E5676_scaffold225G00020 [Cucumis melo var. makuwa]
MTLLLSMLSIPRSELTLSIPHLLLKSSISLLLHLFSLHILLLGTMVAIVSMEQPIQIDRPWMPCDYSQHVRRLKARLDQMNKFLQRMQLSVLVELSTIKELLNVLVKGKTIDSQSCYCNRTIIHGHHCEDPDIFNGDLQCIYSWMNKLFAIFIIISVDI